MGRVFQIGQKTDGTLGVAAMMADGGDITDTRSGPHHFEGETATEIGKSAPASSFVASFNQTATGIETPSVEPANNIDYEGPAVDPLKLG